MKSMIAYATHTTALVMGVAACLVFFMFSVSYAHAEEIRFINLNEPPAQETQVKELKKQVEMLRARIAEQRLENKASYTELKEKHSEEREAAKTEYKKKKRKSREEFMASLADLSGEEKRAAIIAYIAQVKAEVAEKKEAYEAMKAERSEVREEIKTDRAERRADFQESIKNLTGAERRAAILEYIAEVRAQVLERQKQLAEKLQEESDDDVSEKDSDGEENEDEDESEEEHEEEGEENEDAEDVS